LSDRLTIRLTPVERAELAAAAETAALTVSEYIRRRSLGRRVAAPHALTDLQTLGELRRLGGLIKHLATTGRGAPDDLRAALTELREAAAALAALCS
jgi:hypothetical protein